ncbi:two-component system regulatory protein YycI [Aquibacillus sp. 3ASR75-11]|uniref:Two-component system regulatory protein YycI n=1 Tax=Terrihalobacillus insolitus TaxID=2950438 RepID=A0A9X3WUE4_9BACI|nr:two-component system regulatory protein YycI [Terrihalobacillus insolitus]MDC3425972.1 two-component system regulatory protein YycI [Terrihalobacillus insolitus]
MLWGQVKTLFILCFLILDLFLIQQFLEKKESQTDIGLLSDPKIEESLEDNVTFSDKISKESLQQTLKETYISAERKSFSADEIAAILNKDKENQTITIKDEQTIISTFQEPVPTNPTASEDELVKTVKSNVNFGDKYAFWDRYEVEDGPDTLIFFQTYQDRLIYYNEGGTLLVHVNDNNEILGYAQTLLTEVEKTGETEELMEAYQAVTTLFNQNEIQYGDEITNVSIGYHTLIDNGEQIFAPTWRISVNSESSHFVNAFEGYSFSTDDENFVKKAESKLFNTSDTTTKWSGEE